MTHRQDAPNRLVLRCPSCQHDMLVAEEYLGKRMACPECGTHLVVSRESTMPHRGPERRAPRSGRSSRRTRLDLDAASQLAEEGHYAEAIESLKPHFARHPTRDVCYALGYCYYKLRDFSQAQALLERAAALGSRRAQPLLERLEERLGKGVTQAGR